jgi:hypothetical protein
VHEAWRDFLDDGTAPGHGVEIYTREAELTESVVRFLEAGFAAGSCGVVVATAEHADAIRAALPETAPLVVADAQETLDSLFVDGALSLSAFQSVVGGLLDHALDVAPGPPRAFGEMVDLLCRSGRVDDAIALEELWEELRRARRFSLLCGYRLDVFDAEAQTSAIPAICEAHSHVLPAHDVQRFDEAVTRALTEVLGPATTKDIYYIVSRPMRSKRVPVAQDALRWLTSSFPQSAERVLETARGYYAAA